MHKYSVVIRIILSWKYFKLKIFFIYSYWSYVLWCSFNKSRNKVWPSKLINTFSEEFTEAYGVLCKSKKALRYDGHSYDLRWQIDKGRRPITPILDKTVSTIWICEKAGINAEFCTSSDKIHTLFDIPKCSSLSDEIVPICFLRSIVKNTSPSPFAYKLSEKLPVRKELREEADEWFNKHIKGDWVAVHYRGTDIEARKATTHKKRYKIELEPYTTYLRAVLDDKCSIFACSDQVQFVDKMQVVFPGRVFARDIQRSSSGKALHRYPGHKSVQQQKDALIDMLILAKADLIYTTGSAFADAVRYFNPKTKIISLDERKVSGHQTPIPRKDVFDNLKIK